MLQKIELKSVTDKRINAQLSSLANIIVPDIGKLPYLLDDLNVTYGESVLSDDGKLTKCILSQDFSKEMYLTNVTIILPYRTNDDKLQFANITDWLLETKIIKNRYSLTCSHSVNADKLNEIYQQLYNAYGTNIFFMPMCANDFELKERHKACCSAGYSAMNFVCLKDHVIKYDDQIVSNCIKMDSINYDYWIRDANGRKKYYQQLDNEFVNAFNKALSSKDFTNYINGADKKKQETIAIPLPPKGYKITQGED